MEQYQQITEEATLIAHITDAIRKLDGYEMLRGSCFSIQSDDPLSNLRLYNSGFDSPALLQSREAMLIHGSNQSQAFMELRYHRFV